MPSTFRIPKADLTGLYGAVVRRVSKKMYGEVPDVGYVYFHHKPLLRAVMGFEAKVGKWDALDPTLKSLAEMAAASTIGCSWCLDFGYYLAHNDDLDLDKISQVQVWRTSDAFDETERQVLEYAEAMSTTPLTVTDEMVAGLLATLGTEAIVELTQMIAVENMRSRFNSAAGLQSQGYSDVCEIPLAPAAAKSDASAARPPVGSDA